MADEIHGIPVVCFSYGKRNNGDEFEKAMYEHGFNVTDSLM